MNEPSETLKAVLADRYTIERELGRGGNAVVYLARDLKHDRPVALKVLLPELALAVRTERFFREIHIAAKLTHPHILTLIDSGQAGEVLYYVMPYVEGESLRDRLAREKQLPVDDALKITRDVASALGYAHAQGIVHRDIKPENILLSHGEALVADFGIARALTAAGGDAVTQSGIAVGTPAYMSPEQGTGSRGPDARADIYSVGCVVYEMLAGHPPFTGATAQEILARHALDPVPSLKAARNAVPESVERAVTRALAKQPADRFPTADALIKAIVTDAPAQKGRGRRVLVPAGFVAVLIAVGLWAMFGRPSNAERASLAVLICRNLSNDLENDYLGEGVTDEFITALSRVEGLRVPGLGSSRLLKGTADPAGEAVRRLGVAHVVECTVRSVADRFRIGVRLLNASGDQVWAQPFEGAASDPLALQDSAARALVAQVPGFVGSAPGPLVRRSTPSPAAEDLYKRGRHLWYQRNAGPVRQAIAYFEQAIALDPTFAEAYSGQADAYVMAGEFNYLPRTDAFPKARAAAQRAVALDSGLGEAYVSLARVRQVYDWDWTGAEEAFKHALRLSPNYPLAHSWYGLFLAWVMGVKGRAAEGVEHTRRAVELDPLNGPINNNHGIALRFARRYDDALEAHRRATEADPGLPGPHGHSARIYVLKGMLREALAEAESAERAAPDRNRGRLESGMVMAYAGRRAEAMAILIASNSHESRARIYLGLGELDRTLDELTQSIEQRSGSVGPTLGDPVWDPIRPHPRFQDLIRRARLE